MKELDPGTFLTAIFTAAVAAADPELTIRRHLPGRPKGRTVVIGAGKGSAQMAQALENAAVGIEQHRLYTAAGCRRGDYSFEDARRLLQLSTQLQELGLLNSDLDR